MQLFGRRYDTGRPVRVEIAAGKIVPSPLEREVGRQVAVATGVAASETGVARLRLSRDELDRAVRGRF